MVDAHNLFVEHRDGVFRYLSRIVGHSESARDLTQEVFLRVSRSAMPVGSEVEVRAWVFKIARNLALNHVRDGRRRPEAVLLPEISRPATQELAAALDQALLALSGVDRDVFLLRESVGLSYEDIAAACDLTADAVRARLQRARQQLREILGGPGGPMETQRRKGVRLTPLT